MNQVEKNKCITIGKIVQAAFNIAPDMMKTLMAIERTPAEKQCQVLAKLNRERDYWNKLMADK